jgi:hypothetical protein
MSGAGSYDGGFSGAMTEFDTGAQSASTPQVSSRPPDEAQARSWQAPDVRASGHFAVHTDVLNEEAAKIRSKLAELRSAMAELQQDGAAFDCLAFWHQGQTMCANLEASVSGLVQVSQQTHNAHAETAGKLRANADAYANAEAQSHAAVKSAGGQHSGWLS